MHGTLDPPLPLTCVLRHGSSRLPCPGVCRRHACRHACMLTANTSMHVQLQLLREMLALRPCRPCSCLTSHAPPAATATPASTSSKRWPRTWRTLCTSSAAHTTAGACRAACSPVEPCPGRGACILHAASCTAPAGGAALAAASRKPRGDAGSSTRARLRVAPSAQRRSPGTETEPSAALHGCAHVPHTAAARAGPRCSAWPLRQASC